MTALIGNPLLLTSAASSDDSYKITKSLRFDHSRSPSSSLQRAGTTEGDRTKFTLACWVKRTRIGAYGELFAQKSGTPWSTFGFDTDNKLDLNWGAGDNSGRIETVGLFRDQTAWMHVCLVWDTTQPTETERARIYVNGHRQAVTNSGGWPALKEQTPTGGWNDDAGTIYVGGGGPDGSSALLADVWHLDGVALGPSPFGEFDASGTWMPKELKLPTINTDNGSPTWSSNTVSGTGSFYSNMGADKMFDGLAGNGSGSDPSSTGSTITFTPASEIAFTTSVEICMADYAGGQWMDLTLGNGRVITKLPSGDNKWIMMYEGKGTVKSIKARDSGTYYNWQGIKIDGVELVDGKVDTAVFNNPHDGTVWSTAVASGAGSPVSDIDHAFDGDSSTMLSDSGGTSAEYVLTLPRSIPNVSKVEIQPGSGQPNGSRFKCDIDGTTHTYEVSGGSHPEWVPVYGGAAGTLTALRGQRTSSNTGGAMRGVRVNGHILIDGRYDNSFHLEFKDSSKSRYLGKDTYNGKLADATGGLPIYNTTDAYGDVKGSINTGDSNKASLKLAVPLSGDYKSYHGTANGDSGNDITASTNSGVSNDTTQSRFYRSSTKFDSGNVEFTASNDYDFDGDFCIEVWLRKTADTNKQVICDGRSGGSTGYMLWVNDSGVLKLSLDSDESSEAIAGSTSISNNIWYHVAVTRSGSGSNNVKMFLNGVNIGQATNTSSLAAGAIKIGERQQGTSMSYFAGNMQDFRLYKGAAKYTANFIPPNRFDFITQNINTTISSVTNHSDYLTSTTGGFNSDGGPELGFDGNTGTQARINSVGAQLVWEPPCGIHVETSLEFYQASNWEGTNHAYINGKDCGNMATGSTGWLNLNFTGTLWKFEIGKNSSDGNGNAHPCLNGLRLNGSTVISDSTSLTGKTWHGEDSLTDSPTNSGTKTGNCCTWNPLTKSASVTLSESNLKQVGSAAWDSGMGTMGVASGKWYYEVTMTKGTYSVYGVADAHNTDLTTDPYNNAKAVTYVFDSGKVCNGNISSPLETVATSAAGDVVGIAFDADAKKVWFLKNGTSLSGTPGSSGGYTLPTADFYTPFGDCYSATTHSNFGQRPFMKSVPSGFKALCTANLDDTFGDNDDLNNPSKYFDIVRWRGFGGTSNRDLGLDFTPDFVWAKGRNTTYYHQMYDSARGYGSTKALAANADTAEGYGSQGTYGWYETGTNKLVLKDGSGDPLYVNESNKLYVAWLWDAGTTAATASSQGSITPSAQWVNNTAGFSISKWTATNANATIGHGLSTPPEFILLKRLDSTSDWGVYHKNIGNTGRLKLNNSDGTSTHSTFWQDTSPTNTVFSVGTSGDFNGHTGGVVAYCWTSIPGYSAFGTYYGTDNDATGPYVYCGFRPAWIIIKTLGTSVASSSWVIHDVRRDQDVVEAYTHPNPSGKEMLSNVTDAEYDYTRFDILSNGWKTRTAEDATNYTAHYVWAAFAEAPFKISRAQ